MAWYNNNNESQITRKYNTMNNNDNDVNVYT